MLRAKNFGSGLLQLGLVPGEGTRVAVLLRNCPEWTIAELGLFMLVKIILLEPCQVSCCQVVDGVGASILQAGSRLHLLHPS